MLATSCFPPAGAVAPHPPPTRRPRPSALLARTPEEYTQGHAPGAVNIPWMLQTAEGRQHNERFVEQVITGVHAAGAVEPSSTRLLY